ncbi:MAG TPA: riboflavin synthase [Tepidisphaeraceae bacterium]|nr:riboflavin synthase [Tepidisphaeraceae bacterium]
MFTGIVEKTVKVVGVSDGPKFRRLTLATGWDDVRLGESVAVNGVCLTIAELMTPGQSQFDVVEETLRKTNLGTLRAGDGVHVERALRVGDRVDGHFVQGHVDGQATLVDRVSDAREWRLRCRLPPDLAKFLAPKGSVAIDGVSLTVAKVERHEFEVALIPTTISLTALGQREIGWNFNYEADILGKQVVYYLEQREKRE